MAFVWYDGLASQKNFSFGFPYTIHNLFLLFEKEAILKI